MTSRFCKHPWDVKSFLLYIANISLLLCKHFYLYQHGLQKTSRKWEIRYCLRRTASVAPIPDPRSQSWRLSQYCRVLYCSVWLEPLTGQNTGHMPHFFGKSSVDTELLYRWTLSTSLKTNEHLNMPDRIPVFNICCPPQPAHQPVGSRSSERKLVDLRGECQVEKVTCWAGLPDAPQKAHSSSDGGMRKGVCP